MEQTPTQACIKRLESLLRARHSLLWLVTREEQRAELALIEACSAAKYEVRQWDCWRGITEGGSDSMIADLPDPAAALKYIDDRRDRCVYTLRDVVGFMNDPTVVRAIKSVAQALQVRKSSEASAIVIITPRSDVPPELQGVATVLDFPLPARAELAGILDDLIRASDDTVAESIRNGARDAAIEAALGLTATEAANAYASCIVAKRTVDAGMIAEQKRQVIARTAGLTWVDPDPRGLDAVGGLDCAKPWIKQRQAAYSKAAREYGLRPPRGAMLVGVSGCGKSLLAKATASAWGVPLLMFDLGATKSKWVGESEGQLRSALQAASTIAPCVLLIDEVEKAMAGATQGAADGGVSGDQLGALLTYMEENQSGVFVIMTANDISKLPPELTRRGRVDELWFVDLPTEADRRSIITAALGKFGRTETVSAERIARVTEGFTGAEIASLVPDAMYAAFADEGRPITTDDIVAAAACVVPLSRTQEERIGGLRKWAKGRCRPASTPEESGAAGRKLDL